MFLDFDNSACKRLINRAYSQQETIELLEKIFTSKDEVKTIGYLRGEEAQAFINVLDEVCSTPPFPRHGLITSILLCSFAFELSPSTNQALDFPNLQPRYRNKCLSALCKLCGRHALLPKSLQIPLCYDRSDTPLYRGGSAEVWKGEHQGLQVVVKVLRVYSTSHFEKIASVGSRDLSKV